MKEDLTNSYNNRQLITWRIIALVLAILLITIVILYSLGVGWKDNDNKTNNNGKNAESILTLWEKNSTIFTKLIPYVKDVTNKNIENLIIR